jgi:protein SFI1
VGFRSAAAGGRFLQARRRGASRLAFHSASFGVWEQWELVAGDPGPRAWACMPLAFRSRRLPQARSAFAFPPSTMHHLSC